MKLPKYAVAGTSPGNPWGVVRLRKPVIIVEFSSVNHDAKSSACQPYVWPPDIKSMTTESRFHPVLAKMREVFENETNAQAELLPLSFDLTRALPRWLVLSHKQSDFTGVLDTERGVLWVMGADVLQPVPLLEWRIHPTHPPRLEITAATSEISAFWHSLLAEEKKLDSTKRSDAISWTSIKTLPPLRADGCSDRVLVVVNDPRLVERPQIFIACLTRLTGDVEERPGWIIEDGAEWPLDCVSKWMPLPALE